ncbi:hypothetical protein BH11ARM1_BH11ARM1_16740 [soil metagenome]
MFRIGLMGCGSVADFGHVPAILSTPGLELVALFDPSQPHLQALGDKYGIAGRFDDAEQFFAQKLDAVIISSPPFVHLENALLAFKHGCDVLCEKPLASTEEEAREMEAAAVKAGRKLYTAFVYRFSPVAQQIREWVHARTVGEIKALRLIYDWGLHGQYMQDSAGKWVESPLWHGRMIEGGPMVDCGVHQIDLARWWLGSDVKTWQSAGAWVSNYEAPDHVYVHLRHESGALTTVETSFTYDHTAREPVSIFTYDLIGTGGTLHYNRDGYILEARTGEGTIRVPGASEKNFPGMWSAFQHALETGDPGDLASPDDGIRATAIANEATASAIAQS